MARHPPLLRLQITVTVKAKVKSTVRVKRENQRLESLGRKGMGASKAPVNPKIRDEG
jgi:hypothetical protein